MAVTDKLPGKKEIRISLWNALFAIGFTGGLASGAGVANKILTFAQSQFISLGDLGVVPWGLVLALGSLGGAALTNEFNYSEYALWQRIGLGLSGLGIASVFMFDPVTTFIHGNVWIGVGTVLAGGVLYFVISVADAEGALMS